MLYRVLRVVSRLLYLIEMSLVVRAVLSWFQGIDFLRPFYEMLVNLTEPLVGPVRRFIYKIYPGAYSSPLDLSVLATMVLIELVRMLIL